MSNSFITLCIPGAESHSFSIQGLAKVRDLKELIATRKVQQHSPLCAVPSCVYRFYSFHLKNIEFLTSSFVFISTAHIDRPCFLVAITHCALLRFVRFTCKESSIKASIAPPPDPITLPSALRSDSSSTR